VAQARADKSPPDERERERRRNEKARKDEHAKRERERREREKRNGGKPDRKPDSDDDRQPPPDDFPELPSWEVQIGREVELMPGVRYRATLELTGIKALANNAMVAEELQKGGPHFSDLAVLGRDTKRTATGVYICPRKRWTLPPEIVKLERQIVKPDEKPEPKPDDKPAPAGRTPSKAAEALYSYVTARIRSGQAATLGDKSQPNEVVRDAQRDMRKIATDGIYGPKTMARGKELLGKPFPPRTLQLPAKPAEPFKVPPKAAPAPKPAPAPKAPAKPAAPTASKPAAPPPATEPVRRAPEQAARELLAYVKAALASGTGLATKLGTKATPSATVRDAQRDMGQITADGIYGPATRERGRALISTPFPPR
jgi:hypothetical protein